jgi:sugar transferase (PEP-CTERM/EpsH1 system associated)
VRLLFLGHRVPYPPDKGDKIRSFHELSALAARGHEIHLAAFAHQPNDLGHETALAGLCASIAIVRLHKQWARLGALSSLFSHAPLSVGYFASRRMDRVVQRLAKSKLDAVLVCSSTMAQYVPPELAARTVVDLVDVDSEKWRSYARSMRPPAAWVYALEWRRLRRHEKAIVARYPHAIVTTRPEAALLGHEQDTAQSGRLHVINNGVDLEGYRPAKATASPRLADASTQHLVFVGRMDYFPNVDGVRYFVEQVLPYIRQREPHVRFWVVGSNPTAEVRRLGRQAGVHITGFVRDVRPYLAAATACVVPLHVARGVQNKVLEAMAAGRAVIATPQAVAGLRVVDGRDLLVAHTPGQFVHATLAVLSDERLRTQLGDGARRFVQQEHDWAPLMARLVGLIESVGAGPKERARSGYVSGRH